jgi:hypothetical protein
LFAALFAVLALIPACNKKKGFGGNFEGEVTLRTTRAGAPAQDMIVRAKGDKLRFDTPAPDGKMNSALFDPATNKVTMIIDAQKAYMDMDFSGPSGAGNTNPSTSSTSKTGKYETVAGYDCEDWVVKDPSGRTSQVCMAEGLAFFDLDSVRHGGGAAWNKELHDKKYFPLRSVELDASGKELSRSEAIKVEAKKLDDALFTVPAGYTRISGVH